MPKSSPNYIDSAEVCERLGIDRSTLSRWVASERLVPAMRVGGNGAFLFDAADIDDVAKELAS